MKRFSEKLNAKASTVKLRAAEKRDLRERLTSYMEYHPLPAEMKEAKVVANQNLTSLVAEPFQTFSIPFAAIFKSSAFAAVLLVIIVPFVAEKSVPGDALYAVKVQFNEELRSTLTFDTYQKVEWETERLNRRIAEARLLASEGRLTEDAEADVAKAVRTHSANAQREIEELRVEDEDAATIASIALDTTLELQSSSLKGGEEVAVSQKDMEGVDNSVDLIAVAIDESRTNSDEITSTTTAPAYDKLTAKVEQNTTRIYELLTALEKIATEEELADIVRRSEDINRAMAEAIEIKESDELGSRLRLVSVLQSTQRLVVYMTELEVIKTIDIETLIPVVLTEEEEVEEQNSVIDDLNQKSQEIEMLLKNIDDEEIISKVRFVQDRIDFNLVRMSSSSKNFAAHTVFAKEGIALADDALALLRQQIDSDSAVEEIVEEKTSTTTEEVNEELQAASSTEEVIEEGEIEVVEGITEDVAEEEPAPGEESEVVIDEAE